MDKNQPLPQSKVAVDTRIAETIPTVLVASPPPLPDKQKEESSSLIMLPVLLIRRIVNFFMDFLETSVVALSIFVVVYLFFVQPHEIKGNSMEPNFHNNEYILTDKISYRFSEPQRGDVIIFKAPRNPDQDYIKRIIGVPGNMVKIQGGSVYINGVKLDETYLKDSTNLLPGNSLKEGQEITVGPNTFFVLGDNRSHSSDSREFGPIASNLIIGKALLRYWPLTEFGLVSGAHYNLD